MSLGHIGHEFKVSKGCLPIESLISNSLKGVIMCKINSISYFLVNSFIITILVSCASVAPGAIKADSTSEIPTIYKKYEQRFEKTNPGMIITDFKKLWPEAYLVSKELNVSIYEFKDTQLYYTSHDESVGQLWTGSIYTQEHVQKVWFYFSDEKLTKYCEPNQNLKTDK